jgi:uncharacterized protein involved in exopolysaccharide biosynthesis
MAQQNHTDQDPLVQRWLDLSKQLAALAPKATSAQALAQERLRVLDAELEQAQATFGTRDIDALRTLYKEATQRSQEALRQAQEAAAALSAQIDAVMACLQDGAQPDRA